MAYYLSKERDQDCVASYRRYQEYLREHQQEFPPTAFMLGTSEWYQNPTDHRCPHDGWLEDFAIAETSAEQKKVRSLSVKIRLLGAYHDGHIEFYYPKVFSYTLGSPNCKAGLGDWRCDEFRLSDAGHLIHEIEWSGSPNGKDSRWIIEASDVEFQWIPLAV